MSSRERPSKSSLNIINREIDIAFDPDDHVRAQTLAAMMRARRQVPHDGGRDHAAPPAAAEPALR